MHRSDPMHARTRTVRMHALWLINVNRNPKRFLLLPLQFHAHHWSRRYQHRELGRELFGDHSFSLCVRNTAGSVVLQLRIGQQVGVRGSAWERTERIHRGAG